MSTAVPTPSPPQPPKFVPKDNPSPPKPTVRGPYSAKTLQLVRDNHGDGTHFFGGGSLRAVSHVQVCPREPPVVMAPRAPR